MRQIVRVLIFATSCFIFLLMFGQAWATCEPQIKAQCEGLQLDRLDWHKADLEDGNFRNANLKHANLADTRSFRNKGTTGWCTHERSDPAGRKSLQAAFNRQLQLKCIRITRLNRKQMENRS